MCALERERDKTFHHSPTYDSGLPKDFATRALSSFMTSDFLSPKSTFVCRINEGSPGKSQCGWRAVGILLIVNADTKERGDDSSARRRRRRSLLVMFRSIREGFLIGFRDTMEMF